MSLYIVISQDGFTQDDLGNEVENCQVIVKVSAPSANQAAEMARIALNEEKRYFENLRVYELRSIHCVLDTHGTFPPDKDEE